MDLCIIKTGHHADVSLIYQLNKYKFNASGLACVNVDLIINVEAEMKLKQLIFN